MNPGPVPSAASRRRKNGFALVIVLWSLVFLGLIAAHILAAGRTEINLARNIADAAKVEALADAGFAKGVFQLLESPKDRWDPDGSAHDVDLPGGRVTITIDDEAALINPNVAPQGLMAALLQLTGADAATAKRLAAAIAEYVHKEDKKQPPGTAAEEYRKAGLPYGPANAPLDSVDQIGLVLGMTPDLVTAMKPYLTIYSDNAQPETKHASALVLRAIANAAAAPAAAQPEAQPQGSNGPGERPTPAPPQQPPPPGAQAGLGFALNANQAHGTARLKIRAVTPAGSVFIREAVVRLDAMAPKSYSVLGWWRRSEDDIR